MNNKEIYGWGSFFIANALFFIAMGLSYLTVLPQDLVLLPLFNTKVITSVWLFSILALLGQMTLWALIPALMVLLVFALFPKVNNFRYLLGVLLMSMAALLIMLDSFIYHQYRFHVMDIAWQILSSGASSQVLVFTSAECLLAAAVSLAVILFEVFIAYFIWHRQLICFSKKLLTTASAVFIASLLISYGILIYVQYFLTNTDDDAINYQQLLSSVSKIIPYYDFISTKLHLIKNEHDAAERKFNYPLNFIQAFPPSNPLNIVIIAIDTWRFDMLNSQVSPNIYTFAQRAWYFENHYSGGNWTQPGIFSLFYSLPANYWPFALQDKQGPVLINELLKAGYQMGIYGSASLRFPAFNQTVFRDIADLNTETAGNSSSERDQKITQEFQQFVSRRDRNHPFFTFLFYDEVHDWCGSQQPYAKSFQPAINQCDRLLLGPNTNAFPYLNRYRNAVHFVDALIGKDLQVLKQNDLLKNTIVIITADHGEEFNDTHHNYWGHASDFNKYQVKVPLVLYWPKLGSKIIQYQTSHYDIVPTLLTGVLGITNAMSDYSVGVPLFASSERPYLIIDSYKDYAVLTPQKICPIYPGSYAHTLDKSIAKRVSNDLSRYLT